MDLALRLVSPRLFLLGFLVVVPTVAVVFGNNSGAVILGAIGAAALLLTRLEDITGFKLPRLEAELKQSITEANTTIQQLRELALAIAEPTLNEMAMSGEISHRLDFSTHNESKEKIVSTLRKIGVPEHNLMKALGGWTEITLRKLSNLMSQRIHELHPELDMGVNLQGQFQAIRLIDGKAAKPEVISGFLHQHKLYYAELLKMADDYKHLHSTGEVRRPELLTNVGL